MFDKYNIIHSIEKQGFFEITSEQINEFREARLMTKFDNMSNLPEIFKNNELAILPLTRGSYILSRFEAYKKLDNINDEIIKVNFPKYIQSINYESINSEATAINCAYVSGIIADFVEDDELLPTVNGRMSSEEFSFNIKSKFDEKNIKIDVKNSQIEIDGGYEGLKNLTLIEAKNFLSDDFLIRQLYYPFRLWQRSISKEVRTVFMVYTNGLFSLYEYKFMEPDNYNSLVLVKQKNYMIEEKDIELEDIINVYEKIKYVDEPEVPFPQADRFERIINLCELLNERNQLSKEEITYEYDFDPRQADYYANAGKYLNLIEKNTELDDTKFCLTEEGKSIFKLNFKQRQLKFVELILRHQAFGDTMKLYVQELEMPTRMQIVEIMKNSKLHKVESASTFERRASTISGWINWILDLINS
ncbi:MAG: hypothetical protein A2Y24_01465 [Clostridiales bacterium GWE2_32_10]|nr:MAG: hypothetical protein A2Y24_01465 [Clostridiales bacterium GWE2_32_10]HBY19998.1 transcriptional regulator [Clostridiales bacterium]